MRDFASMVEFGRVSAGRLVQLVLIMCLMAISAIANAQYYIYAPSQSSSGSYTVKVNWGYIEHITIKESKQGEGQIREVTLAYGEDLDVSGYSEGVYTYLATVKLIDETNTGRDVTYTDSTEVLKALSSPSSASISDSAGTLGDTIDLTWSAVSGADYYDIEFRVDSGVWQDLDEVDSDQPKSLSVELLHAGSVEFQVQACKFSNYGTGNYICSSGEESEAIDVSLPISALDFSLDNYGYAVFVDDYNSDGFLDYHFYSSERLLILHGDIATPITLPPNPIFTIYGSEPRTWFDGDTHYLEYENISEVLLADAVQLTFGTDYLVGDFDNDGQVDFLFRGESDGELPFIVYGINQFSYPSAADDIENETLAGLVNDRSNSIYIDDVGGNGSDDLIIDSGSSLIADTAYLSVSGMPTTETELIEPELENANIAGSLSGTAAVSPSGAATYNLQLELPQGSGGHTPELSLGYSSQGRNGLMGLGWGISGLSVIRYCHRTLVHDDSEVLLGEKDRFCVDGQRLVITSGSYGSVNSTYATELNSFRTFKATGSGSITGFEVTTKGGETAYYTVNSGGDSFVLDKLYDSSGNNAIEYYYIEDSNGFRIDRIEYAFGTGSEANAVIQFEYESRLDFVPENLMVGDYPLKRRLKAISITNNDASFREYNLGYLYESPSTENPPLSRLYSIQQCVGNSCSEATTFDWQVVDALGFSSTEYTTMKFHSNANRFQPGRVADLNGDGMDDYIWFYKNSDEERYLQVALSDGEKWNVQDTNHSIRAYYYLRYDWNLLDYDGDGQLDFIHRQSDNSWAVRLFDGTKFSSTATEIIPSGAGTQSVLSDITGDGLGDLIIRDTDKKGISFYYAQRGQNGVVSYPTSPSKSIAITDSSNQDCNSSVEVGDLHSMEVIDSDGDGRTEFLVPVIYKCDKTYRGWRTVTLSSSSFSGFNWEQANTHNYIWLPADLNHDGLTDMILKDENDDWSYTLSDDGDLDNYIALSEVTGKKVQLVDFNHDGFLDIVWPGDQLKVKLWNGSGFDGVIETSISAGSGDSIHATYADINGDGFQEYARIYDGESNHYVNFYAPNASYSANNVIKAVNGGLGEESTFTYKPLTDTSVYVKGQGAALLDYESPVFDIGGTSYIVSQLEFSMPTASSANNTEQLTYNYEGLRFQGGGRGSLGFEKITTTDSRTGYTTTTFAQEFPYIGMPLSVKRYTPQGKLLYSQANTLAKRGSSTAPYWPYTEESTEVFYLLKSDGAAAGSKYKTVVTENTYDDYGNLEESTVSTKNAAGGVVQKVVQENGFDGETWYREKGRVTSTKITTTRGSDVETREVSFEYYPEGGSQYGLLKAEHIEPEYSGEDAAEIKLSTTYTYDDYANRLSTTKKATEQASEPSRTSYSEYDADKRYVDKVRDSDNRLLSEVVSRDDMGLPTKTRTYLDASASSYVTTTYEYDAFGRETYRATDGAPSVTTEYGICSGSECSHSDAATYVVATSETGAYSTTYFDMLGRQLRQESTGLTQSQIIVTDTEYDELGRVERQSEPYTKGTVAEYWTTNYYDLNSRITSVELPDSNTVSNSELTLENNLVVATSTNPGSQNRTEKTNVLGEAVYIQDHYQGTVEYQYDPVGNVTEVISHGRSGENLGITISAKYDARGRKVAMSDPDKGDWTYTYNAFGELVEQEDGKQQRTVTEYDHYGRPLRRTDYTAAGSEEGHTRWYYDDKDAAGVSVANALGKVTAVVMSASANDEQCYTGTSHYCAIYSYNSLGQQTAVATGLGTVGNEEFFASSVGYDSFGRPQYQYDVLDGEVSNGANGITSGIQEHYTNTGALEYVTDLNTGREVYRVLSSNSRGQVTDFDINSGGVRISNGYDSATGRLLSQKADNSASATTVQQMAYGWDAVGNLVSRNNQRTGKKESFCYDNLNRLLQVNANTTSTSSCNPNATGTQYQYDSIGNILSKDGAAYLYESAKPHAVTKAAGVDYAYNDSNGNLTSDSTGRAFTYTTFDKPSLITNTQSGDSTTFTYGPDRARYQRVDTRSDGEVVTTLYLGGVERIHYQSEGSYHWKRYLPGGAVFTYETNGAYEQQSLTERYLLTDHIGSTDVVLDENGNVLESQSMAFDPWGKRRDSDWDSLEISDLIGSSYQLMDSLNEVTTHGFTGHEMVDALGIIHMNGRIYDPNLGRFLQADPMIDGVEDTQGYNRYSYVKGNPLTLTDPTGYYSWGDFKKDTKEVWDSITRRGVQVGTDSNGNYSFSIGQNPDHAGFWAPQGAGGAQAPEGASSATFARDNNDSVEFYEYSAQGRGGFDSTVSEEALLYLIKSYGLDGRIGEGDAPVGRSAGLSGEERAALDAKISDLNKYAGKGFQGTPDAVAKWLHANAYQLSVDYGVELGAAIRVYDNKEFGFKEITTDYYANKVDIGTKTPWRAGYRGRWHTHPESSNTFWEWDVYPNLTNATNGYLSSQAGLEKFDYKKMSDSMQSQLGVLMTSKQIKQFKYKVMKSRGEPYVYKIN
ncbi:RHS repeat-associated core domain-containing protein [Microbulbifer sp. TRSA001]|uniref:RHS repeat-associated core domain-containing protein n=1 Tax=Microbulbifer sp. TRSA001 TaxID=3243381 RepID=UPI00403990E7